MKAATLSAMDSWRDRARAAMKRRGVTQDALAEKLNLTQGGLQHWLAGTRQPSLEQINEIARHLEVAPAWLTHGLEAQDMLDGLSEPARHALRRFIAAERGERSPSAVWQTLEALADLAFSGGGDPAHHKAITDAIDEG